MTGDSLVRQAAPRAHLPAAPEQHHLEPEPSEESRLGLFDERRYVDVDGDAAEAVVGRADFRADGEAAQRSGLTLLKNGDALLPLTGAPRRYVEGVDRPSPPPSTWSGRPSCWRSRPLRGAARRVRRGRPDAAGSAVASPLPPHRRRAAL
ncbi:hypothetical protein RKD49_000130 [Streptomyces glaucescens]